MQLTVLSVAYPLVPVSADTAGGAEQIVSILDRHIVRAGGRSLVMAAAGSRVSGKLIPTPPFSGKIDGHVRAWAAQEHRRVLGEALRKLEIDVVQLHGLDFHEYLPEERVPCLATLHLPPQWYPPEIFGETRPNLLYNCVSHHQRRNCPESRVPIRTITHGIEVESLRKPMRKRNYVASLGRICPEKGIEFAIEAAKQARMPLIIAGRVFPYEAHQKYFATEIAPRLDGCVRFCGPAGFQKKRRLLAGARCLLVPSKAAETSSLVAMEALACGTPVVAFRSGALPEIVEHGRTGFIVDTASEMAEAIHRAGELDPEDCRASAGERFSAARMAEQYFRTYHEMIACRRDLQKIDLPCATPVT